MPVETPKPRVELLEETAAVVAVPATAPAKRVESVSVTAAPKPVAEPPAKPVAEPVKKTPEPVPQVASTKQQSSPPTSAVGKPRSAQWIRDQPGKYFTLQLFATTSRDKREQFLRQQDHREQFATFETKRDGVPWFAVAYGSYATQAEAKSAAASLPASVGRVDPWVRTFASVQATLD
jgi:DamX protein